MDMALLKKDLHGSRRNHFHYRMYVCVVALVVVDLFFPTFPAHFFNTPVTCDWSLLLSNQVFCPWNLGMTCSLIPLFPRVNTTKLTRVPGNVCCDRGFTGNDDEDDNLFSFELLVVEVNTRAHIVFETQAVVSVADFSSCSNRRDSYSSTFPCFRYWWGEISAAACNVVAAVPAPFGTCTIHVSEVDSSTTTADGNAIVRSTMNHICCFYLSLVRC